MFHHLHNDQHPPGPGSIDSEELDDLITRLARTNTLLPAQEFLRLATTDQLPEDAVCLTFDDSLLCQFDIALPVLDAHQTSAFFFVYSSAFTDTPDPLEIYRHFRVTKYETFHDFFEDFIAKIEQVAPDLVETALKDFSPKTYLKTLLYYSDEERTFRYLRDTVLTTQQYSLIMRAMMKDRNFDPQGIRDKLFMKSQHLIELTQAGHIVGLHSHSHPVQMHKLSVKEQQREYRENAHFLQETLGSKPESMSHPMGRYDSATLRILTDLGIKLGFCSELDMRLANGPLETMRRDHTRVLAEMRNRI